MANKYIIIGITLLLFVSCGQQQKAKSLVKDFMSDQLHKSEVSYLDFTDVDSTHTFTDSLIQVLRERGAKGVQYQERKGRTLLHLRTKYVEGDDTCSATFYLNPDAEGIVAYKEN